MRGELYVVKLMKYEIKGTYKILLGILALVLILITGIYMYSRDSSNFLNFGAIFMTLSVLVLFGTSLATFLYIVSSFKNELYEDRGYLTFTLPLTGNQIVGAKLLVAMFWFFILGLAIFLYNLMMISIFSTSEFDFSELFKAVGQVVSVKEIIIGVIGGIFSLANFFILIYFSMALGRVTFRNKKIGGLWFVIFLVLSGLLAFIQVQIIELFPYYFDINTFKMGTMEKLYNFEISIGNEVSISSETGIFKLNIASSIYNIIELIALYLGTAYLIEKKIDL